MFVCWLSPSKYGIQCKWRRFVKIGEVTWRQKCTKFSKKRSARFRREGCVSLNGLRTTKNTVQHSMTMCEWRVGRNVNGEKDKRRTNMNLFFSGFWKCLFGNAGHENFDKQWNSLRFFCFKLFDENIKIRLYL